jgi:hypothetical protein
MADIATRSISSSTRWSTKGPNKRERDLRALSPTQAELVAATRWSRLHDPSEGHAQILGEVLSHLGLDDVNLGD